VNVHFSLLPRWRGAAPVERAILAGDAVTGVAIMALEVTLDTGPIYASEVCAVDPDETADELRARLGVIGTRLLIEQLAHGVSAMAVPVPQTGEATYAAKLTVEDAHLDFHTSALHCHRVVRVGRAWTTFRGNRLVIRRSCVATTRDDAPGAGGAAGTLVPGALPPGTLLPGTLVPGGVMTGDGVLELLEVQAAGRSVQSFDSWILGARLQPGERLGL